MRVVEDPKYELKLNVKSRLLPLDTSPWLFVCTVARCAKYRASCNCTESFSHSAFVSISRTVSMPEPPVYRSPAPEF